MFRQPRSNLWHWNQRVMAGKIFQYFQKLSFHLTWVSLTDSLTHRTPTNVQLFRPYDIFCSSKKSYAFLKRMSTYALRKYASMEWLMYKDSIFRIVRSRMIIDCHYKKLKFSVIIQMSQTHSLIHVTFSFFDGVF